MIRVFWKMESRPITWHQCRLSTCQLFLFCLSNSLWLDTVVLYMVCWLCSTLYSCCSVCRTKAWIHYHMKWSWVSLGNRHQGQLLSQGPLRNTSRSRLTRTSVCHWPPRLPGGPSCPNHALRYMKWAERMNQGMVVDPNTYASWGIHYRAVSSTRRESWHAFIPKDMDRTKQKNRRGWVTSWYCCVSDESRNCNNKK
jgi:hypothetical protein